MIEMIKFFYEHGDYSALFFIFLGFMAFVVTMIAASIAWGQLIAGESSK